MHGYIPWLVAGRPGEDDEVRHQRMRGTLRSDVPPRRKADQPRPSG